MITKMKVSYNSKTGKYSISNMTTDDFSALFCVLDVADSQCFKKENEEGLLESGDGFLLLLNKRQRRGLTHIVEQIKMTY